MAGKVDSTTYAAAIARISEAAKHESELCAHLDEVVKGPAFKGSPRSQAFLKHIVERALHGDSADLRERSIGIALFGRPAAYDTADDAIVRVTASDVRKRLLQHYGSAGVDKSFRISLPPGSYVPEFSFAPPSAAAPSSNGSACLDVPSAPEAQPMPVESGPSGAGVSIVELPAVSTASPAVAKPLPRTLIALATLVLLAAIAGGVAVVQRSHSATKQSLISAAFQGTSSVTQVVVADDALVLIQVLLDRRFTLQEYENLAYLQVPEWIQKKDLLRFWGSLSTRQITNLGDLQNAHRIVEALRAENREVTIRQSRQMHARSFRSGNFIILGSSFSNPWSDLFPAQDSNFPFDGLPRPGKPEIILNRHPLPGEPSRFESFKDPTTHATITFARVSLLDNLTRTGRVILVAGQSMSATEMAGELLLRPEAPLKVRKMLGLSATSPLPNLEMVLRISERNEIGDGAQIISARMLPRDFD